MKPRVKYGLVVGVIALVLNAVVSFVLGLCGPLMALIAGAVAGFLTAREETAAKQSDGALYGGIAGLISGTCTLVGQVIGVVGVLYLSVNIGIQPLIGTLPDQSDPSQQAIFWTSGVMAGMCFGIVGLLLSALAGAAVGYLSSKGPTTATPPLEMPGV